MKLKILPAIAVLFVLLLMPTVFAQSTNNCGGGNPPRAQGLVTAPNLSGKFGSTGACITDPKVTFAPFKIPLYADLKSTYYNQSKLSKTSLPADLKFNGDGIYTTSSDLAISSTPTGSGTEVIFINGKLNVNQNVVYHTADGAGGLVFVVRDNVVIDTSVTQVDAVIIAQGIIYTATDSQCGGGPSSVSASALKINGSLISLSGDSQIRFCRKLTNNNNPAELINTQPKYLVLLRNLMADTLQKWSEIP